MIGDITRGNTVKEKTSFISAYHDFRKSVDFSMTGILPDMDNLVWCMLMGVPQVPADRDNSPDAAITAIDQRLAILKAVFVEVNKDQPEDFINKGLLRYDESGKIAKQMLEEGKLPPDLK